MSHRHDESLGTLVKKNLPDRWGWMFMGAFTVVVGGGVFVSHVLNRYDPGDQSLHEAVAYCQNLVDAAPNPEVQRFVESHVTIQYGPYKGTTCKDILHGDE